MKDIVYSYFFIVYLLTSLIYAFYLVFKEKPSHRILNFAFVFWIMTYNFYKSHIMWRTLPFLSKFRKADFMLAMFLVVLLLMLFLTNNEKKKNIIKPPQPVFEKFLFSYFALSIFLYWVHLNLGHISYYKATAYARLNLDAVFIYLGIRRFASKELARMVVKTVIYMGIVAAVASIVQFFIDTKFLRVGPFHRAWEGQNRASGIFAYPYDCGIFMIFSTYAVVYYLKDIRVKVFLITLFIISLILVFTRGTWIAYVLVFIFHMSYYYRDRFRKLIGLILVVSLVISLSAGAYFAQKHLFSGDYTERITVDTVSVRLAFYMFTIRAIPEHWLIGYGDIENNEAYYRGMVQADQSLAWALGRRGGIHNMVLEEAFLRGIFSPLLLIGAFFFFFRFNLEQSVKRKSYLYSIFNNYALGFFIYFFSVGGYLVSRTGFLTVPLFGLMAGLYYNNIDVSDVLPEWKFFAKEKSTESKTENEEIAIPIPLRTIT